MKSKVYMLFHSKQRNFPDFYFDRQYIFPGLKNLKQCLINCSKPTNNGVFCFIASHRAKKFDKKEALQHG